MQFNREFSDFKRSFIEMMKRFESMWASWTNHGCQATNRPEPAGCATSTFSALSGMSQATGAGSRGGRWNAKSRRCRACYNRMSNSQCICTEERQMSFFWCRLSSREFRYRRNSYSVPRMNECIDSLVKAQISSILDAISKYWQIGMDKKDVDKTAFVIHHGLFRYTRMSLGLENVPATFQQAKDFILASV